MQINTDQQKINEILTRGVENVYPNPEFLEKRLKSGEQLSLYLGIDPTGPNLHLGHAIPLLKLKQFQDLGHKIIMLIGDFTGMIGDPTDKSATRVRLTKNQVKENYTKYKKQAEKILDFHGPNKVEVKYNSKWLGRLSFEDVVELSANFTVQRMLERDMFERRIKAGKPVYLHEFLYPLMQGYDTVAMDVDGEVGGNDQTFNMLAGRDLMKALKNKEKFVITAKLLADPTGKKMGKTEGNMITLADTADDMFGKVMSWPDEMIISGFELLTKVDMAEIKQYDEKLKQGQNPRDFKIMLAKEVVKTFIDEQQANEAEQNFINVFQKKERPDEIEEYEVTNTNIVEVLVETKLASSKSEARRLIQQKAVKVDDKVVEDLTFEVPKGVVLQKGKRFFAKIV